MKNVFRRLWIFCLVSLLMISSFSLVCFAETDMDLATFQLTAYYHKSEDKITDASIGILAIAEISGQKVNLVFTPLAPREDGILVLHSTEGSDTLYPMSGVGQIKGYSMYMYVADPDLGAAEGFRPIGKLSKGEKVAFMGYYEDGFKGCETVCTAAGEHPEFETMPEKKDCPVFVVNAKGEPVAYIGKEGSVALAALFEDSGSSPAPAAPPAADNAPAQQETIPSGPIEMPSQEKLYAKAKGNAIDSSKHRNRMVLLGAGAAVAVAAAAVVFVILKNKKVKIDNEWIEEVEEGTELADDRAASRLRMSSGQVIWVRQSVTIGRSKENDVVTNPRDTRVSSRHCRVVSQNGVLFVQDLRSTNGTFVDGHRLQPGQSVALTSGTLVSLGVAKGGEAFTVL